MLSLEIDSRCRIAGAERMCVIEALEPMNLKVHSGGMMLVICEKRKGRCGRGRVSTRKASLVGSYGEGGRGGDAVAGRGSEMAFWAVSRDVGCKTPQDLTGNKSVRRLKSLTNVGEA